MTTANCAVVIADPHSLSDSRIYSPSSESEIFGKKALSPPPCGEGLGAGVVQKAPRRSILHHPHLQLLPARGRRALRH
ncbi:hypothetical protein FVE89_17880 [Methylobacterium sp. 2A]|nr:hypothetical protein [Methylobacterium sp. 2A]